MKHINIEIKARCLDHKKIRELLLSHGADSRGTDHQIDTYFKVNRGRLKLREGTIENFLIFYERENSEKPKRSDVILFKTDPTSSLKHILLHALDTLAVVDKSREIFFIDNVKFHLDTVAGLGTFVEIEAIDKDGTIGNEKLRAQCNDYLNLLQIPGDELISVSYSDLISEKQRS